MNPNASVLSTCSGIGASDVGYLRCSEYLYSEWDKFSAQTYSTWFSDASVYTEDIRMSK